MKRTSLLASTVAAALVGTGCERREAASLDTRTAVVLTAEQRHDVLKEMRTMLGAVSGVLGTTARRDTAGIRAAAKSSGTAAAADPALEKLLPGPWLQLAMRTHEGFDDLAASAGAGQDTIVTKLGIITSNCVACHAMYRLGVR